MSTFKYELENLLTLRQKMEDVKKKEYAQSLEVLEKEKKQKKQIETHIKESNQALKESISDVIDPRAIKQQQNYQLSLERQKELALKNVEYAKNETIKQRKDLLEAMKNKKTLEILKEKKYQQFIIEAKKQEQQIVDEIVSFAYTQKDQ